MRWPWLLLLAAVPLALQPFAPMMEWHADAAAEPWRWLTGHLVHGHAQHLLINLLALLLFGALLVRPGEGLQAFGCALWCALVITFGLPWLAPEVVAYRGLSGVLHGVVLAQCLRSATAECRLVAWLVILKITWELMSAQSPVSSNMVVVHQAHLLGALAGAVWTAAMAMLTPAPGGQASLARRMEPAETSNCS